jgi:hypothetical protein
MTVPLLCFTARNPFAVQILTELAREAEDAGATKEYVDGLFDQVYKVRAWQADHAEEVLGVTDLAVTDGVLYSG